MNDQFFSHLFSLLYKKYTMCRSKQNHSQDMNDRTVPLEKLSRQRRHPMQNSGVKTIFKTKKQELYNYYEITVTIIETLKAGKGIG